MAAIHRPLADWAAGVLSAGDRPVSIAGDCCAALPVLAALQRAGLDPTLVWFDAHGDFNTWETTPSGFLGGMPLAMLVGRGEQSLAEALDLRPLLEEQVILAGARDLDPGEREAVAGSGLLHCPDVAELEELPLPAGPLCVHFDCDVLNPEEAPAMSYLAAGGPGAEALGRVFRRLASSGRLAAVSLSAWNPDLDSDGRTRRATMQLLDELLAG
jgi:arginase